MGYRIVRMSRELFEQFFVEGYTLPTRENERIRVTKGLPEGAKLVGVLEDTEAFFGGAVLLKFAHPSWPETPRGERIPEVQMAFTTEPIEPVPRPTRQLTAMWLSVDTADPVSGEPDAPSVVEG